jgi:eukaryotic-like serine/threonine-protein kinase
MSNGGSRDETIDERSKSQIDGSGAFDRLAEQFAEACRRGEAPSIAGYEARHPEHAEKIRRLLPTVAMMEQLKRGTQTKSEMEAGRPLPERLDEFRVLRELGRGGMGVVYEAVQESLGRHVALKVVHHVHLDARRLERFRREAQAVARLHHTNIVPIFGVGEHEGLPYYAMQYIRGSGLDVFLRGWREETSARHDERARFAAGLGMQAAEALQYAHEQGILHRDVKPANLLVDEHGALWITDFGLAKLVGQDDLTASGDLVGTLRYLAPEALRGETGPRSDVYSLGLTLYELLTLHSPFGDLTPSELLHQVKEGQLPRPRRLDPTIPRDLETVVMKAIAREPDHRYESAGALADDLRCFLEDRPIRARRATSFERAWRWSRRNRMTAALIATAAASLLLAAVVGWIGYATTRKALAGESARRHEAEAATRRADENVALSLEVFGELFDKLSPEGNPFPPPTGRVQRRRTLDSENRPGPPPPGESGGPPPGVPPGPPRRDGTGPKGEPGFPPDGRPGRRSPPPPHLAGSPFDPGGPPEDGPPGPPRRDGSRDNTALLQSILTFYDRFAQRNETNPRLQDEAAWAYFKVGALYDQMGRDEEAARAISRAGDMLEDLIARFPGDAEYRSRLVEIAIMAKPWTADPSSLDRLEGRLHRAREVADGLASEAPENLDYIQSQLFAHAKLGAVLQRKGRADEAEGCYRRAIGLTESLIERAPENARARIDRADIREALAMLLFERGRRDQRDQARSLLDAAAEELRFVETGRARIPPLADRYREMAEDFRQLGETERADEMTRRAEVIEAKRPTPGRNPGPPRPRGTPG